ncbi:hypothetical protein FKM82_027640 [Ascaphus truei]
MRPEFGEGARSGPERGEGGRQGPEWGGRGRKVPEWGERGRPIQGIAKKQGSDMGEGMRQELEPGEVGRQVPKLGEGERQRPEWGEGERQRPEWDKESRLGLVDSKAERLVDEDEGEEEGEEEDDGDTDVEDEDLEYPVVLEQPVGWNRTFHVGRTDFQVVRSDLIDLHCNTSGNLLLREGEALDVTRAFMRRLNHRQRGMYQLLRIVSVEKRLDFARGSRYLLELELRDRSGRTLRFAHYVFAPGQQRLPPEDRKQERDMKNMIWSQRRRLMGAQAHLELCWPLGLSWNPQAVVHFIVPGECERGG